MKELTDKEEKEYVLNQRDEESMSTIWNSILITKTSDARIDTNVTDEDLGDSSTLKSDVGDVEA